MRQICAATSLLVLAAFTAVIAQQPRVRPSPGLPAGSSIDPGAQVRLQPAPLTSSQLQAIQQRLMAYRSHLLGV